jgi:dihydroorotate dehydrogenase
MSAALGSRLALPLLRRLDPEHAHRLALRGLRWGWGGATAEADDPILHVSALGLDFTNPIGLAAGFDKDAEAVAPLARLGFGFVETGTVTPRPQQGNPRPRLFRLAEDHAVINRMGFNNRGIEAYVARLAALGSRHPVPVGANIGINKEDAVPERDYPALVRAVALYADYIVINVSSPNTAGLRALQHAERLGGILAAVRAARTRPVPLLVKVAPDLALSELEPIVETSVAQEADGLIVSNTTIARPPTLRSRHAAERGGLSGAPLFPLSTALLAHAHRMAHGRLVLIGAGGVRSGTQAMAKIQAGAHLVQLYTGFAYEGPALLPRIKRELAMLLRQGGFPSVTAAIGSNAERLARLAEMAA